MTFPHGFCCRSARFLVHLGRNKVRMKYARRKILPSPLKARPPFVNMPTTCWARPQKAYRQPTHRCPIGHAKGRLRVYQTIPPELLHPELFIPAATLLGLLLGSFYNVCIHRYASGESILFPPSHCPHCRQRLRFWELVPVLSYLLLRGQCARCRKPIHIRYPLVELLSGLTSGLLAWRFGPTLAFPVYLAFTGMLIVASGIDLECFILPDGITLGGTALAVPAAIFALGMDWADALLGGLVGGGTFLAVLLIFKHLRGVDGMGSSPG